MKGRAQAKGSFESHGCSKPDPCSFYELERVCGRWKNPWLSADTLMLRRC